MLQQNVDEIVNKWTQIVTVLLETYRFWTNGDRTCTRREMIGCHNKITFVECILLWLSIYFVVSAKGTTFHLLYQQYDIVKIMVVLLLYEQIICWEQINQFAEWYITRARKGLFTPGGFYTRHCRCWVENTRSRQCLRRASRKAAGCNMFQNFNSMCEAITKDDRTLRILTDEKLKYNFFHIQ